MERKGEVAAYTVIRSKKGEKYGAFVYLSSNERSGERSGRAEARSGIGRGVLLSGKQGDRVGRAGRERVFLSTERAVYRDEKYRENI